ncbi:lytic transglycosylase domain-containing protein [Sporichthya polymorpha]|uniref:lytic transglycosylase domain-containing protein n=1 Tax=Sporichthya polymorpha TaxID=35751 RepID=UPI00039D83A4|nr:lytic transglycosylase domain-containing protein [Sporichthya polymorpha]
MRSTRTTVRALAAPLAAVVALSGCGELTGSSGGAGPAPAAKAASTTAATSPERDAVLARPLAGEQPLLPADPRELARYLTVAEDVVRDRAESPARVAAAGWAAQHAYRALNGRPEWHRTVLAALPSHYRKHARRHLRAGEALAQLVGKPATKMPAWQIVEPEPAENLRRYYAAGERRFGVPWEVLAAINLVETRMGRIVGYSTAGARGPMQFMPATWRAYGRGDIDDAHDSILAAARYLAANGGADGTSAGLRRAVRRYNNSGHYVTGVLQYAAVLRADDRAYASFHAWQVYYRTRAGDAVLRVGYSSRTTPPAKRWLADHPEARVRYF